MSDTPTVLKSWAAHDSEDFAGGDTLGDALELQLVELVLLVEVGGLRDDDLLVDEWLEELVTEDEDGDDVSDDNDADETKLELRDADESEVGVTGPLLLDVVADVVEDIVVVVLRTREEEVDTSVPEDSEEIEDRVVELNVEFIRADLPMIEKETKKVRTVGA